MSRPPLIMLTAGGTGGHMFPAEALAAELANRGFRLAFVTDRRGTVYGGALGKAEIFDIPSGGVAGLGPLRQLHSLGALAIGYWRARRLISWLKPAAVIGFGGYASVPAVMAANHAGLPTVIHEQNSVLGRANRLLASGVTRIATVYQEVAKLAPRWKAKQVRTGMPVRPAVLAKRDARYPSLFGHGPVTLLVFGGSQGARIFSELVPKAVLLLPETLQRRLLIEQQCRAEDMDHVKQLYHRHGISADLRLFFDDMPARMANAHLIISRAGASTVAELEVIGRPAILVPYPHAIDDHQTANAQAFSEAGGGWMMPQSMMTAENLAQHLQSLLTAPEKLQSAARHAHRAAIPDATARLADLVVGLTEAAA